MILPNYMINYNHRGRTQNERTEKTDALFVLSFPFITPS